MLLCNSRSPFMQLKARLLGETRALQNPTAPSRSSRRSMRFQPVPAGADLHHDGHLERESILHLVFHERPDCVELRLVKVEDEFVMDLEDHFRLELVRSQFT